MDSNRGGKNPAIAVIRWSARILGVGHSEFLPFHVHWAIARAPSEFGTN